MRVPRAAGVSGRNFQWSLILTFAKTLAETGCECYNQTFRAHRWEGKRRMPFLRGILVAVLLLTGVTPSLAQGYPNRPVRVVVGFTPGGPTDVIARLIAQGLSESLGQQFFVENISGAGGNIAAGQAAPVTPDGYTIMAIMLGFMVNPSF